VFRRADHLAEAIESVLAQSYEHWRLTISEDSGPTEVVRLAVEPYLADDRVSYVSVGEWWGPARTRSSLVAHGQGKYIALIDDDDIWLPGWLERRVAFLEAHPECVMVWGGHLDIDDAGAELRRSEFPVAAGVRSSREFVQRMMRGNVMPMMTVLLRREAYVRAGNRFDARFRHLDDYELWLRMGLTGPVGFLPVHDSAYRLHDGQWSRRHDKALDHLRLIDHLDRLLQEAGVDLRLPESARRRKKADRFLSAALDAAEQGQARTAARRICAAAGLAPQAVATARGLAAIAATVGGRTVSRRIGTLRS
jgi:glycosyltransferase involved in cell wall biosynthesis